MKKLIINFVLAFLMTTGTIVVAQNQSDEYLGLPGDNLNLYAVMDIFRESETLEEFERKINDPDEMINNLDLNGDNYVDYIMVYDYSEGNIHNIVLRVALDKNEQQDVAVFIVEKMRNNAVQIQLIGDEALYGLDYIIEPAYAERPNPGYQGNVSQTQNTNVVYTTYYEVATWPVIIFMSRPVYRPWRSVWYYGYYPPYWHAWNPYYYHYYYGYHYHWHTHYYVHYRPARRFRSDHYHTVYHTSVREASPRVTQMARNGDYKRTYSRPEKRSEGEQLFAQRHPDRYEKTVKKRSSALNGERRMEATPSAVDQRRVRSDSDMKRSSEPSEAKRTTQRNPETLHYQRPAVNRSNENRGNAVKHGSSRPARRESPKVDTRRENRGAAVSKPAPSRQTKTTPNRSVSRSAPERNSRATQSTPRRSSPSYSKPARQERSTPKVNNKRSSSGSVGNSSRSSSRSSGNSVQRSTPKSKSGNTEKNSKNSRRR